MVAYRLYRSGKHKAKFREGRGWLPVETGVEDENGKPISVPLDDVKNYVNEWFFWCMEIFSTTELLGKLPYGEGWMENPWDLVLVIRTLKSEENRWEQQEHQRKYGQGKA
jgi:hypothetical protein